jgi:hypothetical protein
MRCKRPMMWRAGVRGAVLLGLLAGAARPAAASEELGAQRVATSMLTFLKIGVGARAEALGEAFTPVADDATTLHWNPAGLAEFDAPRVHVTHAEWPADINYDVAIFTMPVPKLSGGIGVQIASLRTTLDYTSTAEPLPHGVTFGYSDLLLGFGYARQFTDRFSFGGAFKYLREDLGSDVGGSVLNSWSLDVGTMFRLPYHGFRVSMAWTNFGPDFQPPGGYVSTSPDGTTSTVEYDSFSPASVFAFGAAIEPFETAHYRLLTTMQFDHPADATEQIKMGGELWLDETVALRAGWNPRADAMRFSAGVGLRGRLAGRDLHVDYAYTDGNDLGRIDRFSMELGF